jgi:hypothetical protein
MSLRFKLSPELADGQHWTVCDTLDQLLDTIRAWHEGGGAEAGESFTIDVVEMSDAEVAALPEI